MKHYKKALIVLEENATPKSKQNKLTKIFIETEDDILKDLARRVARMYGYHIKRGLMRTFESGHQPDPLNPIPKNHREWVEMQRVVNRDLRSYLEMRISQAKPEWQVMAEKHGWRPPL